MAIEIRTLRAGDEAVLANVAIDVFDDPIEPRAASLFLADPRHHLVVALSAGVVVGFASGVHYFHPDKPAPELFVNEVGVAPGHLRQGIAARLLAGLFQAGREAGCEQAWVLTDRTNTAAMRLYAKAGGEEGPQDHVMFSFPLAKLASS
jgi:ribosomal protein S18 acetylase RimI-like enzyme